MQETTNYKFKKPEGSDQLDVNTINEESDALDNALDKLSGTLAIVQHTNTATRDIAEGQFVCWKGSLYKASSDITEGDTLSVSNLTACSGGGFNGQVKKWRMLLAYVGYAWLDPGKSQEIHPTNFINSVMSQNGCTEFGGIVGHRILNDNNVSLKDMALATATKDLCVVKNFGDSELMGNVTLYFLAR